MTLSRRAFLRSSGAAVGVALGVPLAAQDRFNQDSLLDFWPLGKITLMHIGPLLGEMMPHYQRPPEVRIGVGDTEGKVPYLTGEAFRVRYGIGGRTPMDYAHTHEHFVEHARAYGKMGGIDRVATVLNAIRAERPGALFLTSGLGPEFSTGNLFDSGRLGRLSTFETEGSIAAGLVGLLKDSRQAKVMHARLERAGKWIEIVLHNGTTEQLEATVVKLRKNGADLIICQSWQDFDACRVLAETVPDLDIIFSNGFSDALPEPERVGKVRVFSSGTKGRFVTRVDVDVKEDGEIELASKLIPIFSDLITPDPKAATVVREERAPYLSKFQQVVGRADALLFRRGALSSSWDEVICAALMAEFGASVAFVPGLRWGRDVLPGDDILEEDLLAVAAGAAFPSFQKDLTGHAMKDLLEEQAELCFGNDQAKRGNIDMMRVGGLGFELEVNGKTGARVGELVLLGTNVPLEMDKTYIAGGWGFGFGGFAGPSLRDVLETYITKHRRVGTERVTSVTLKSTN